MTRLTTWAGITLVAVGIGGYIAVGGASITALIPAFFGLPLALLGRSWDNRSGTRIAISAIAWLGFFGSVPGLVNLISAAAGSELVRPTASVLRSVMAIICGGLALLALRSTLTIRLPENDTEPDETSDPNTTSATAGAAR